ncbi:MAG TPA: DUF6051 family protein [Bacteroidales bacterium]|nr:DUF6051 family protein [Bacteroidales bacterium]
MERTKQLNAWFSYDLPVTIPDRPVRTIPFLFTQDTGREEVGKIREHINAAPFYTGSDSTIEENQQFRYVIYAPAGTSRFNKAIIMLHGLNERSWSKYLPWAEDLVLNCGIPVILFPIAFHMNRTPANWYAPRWLLPWLNRRKQEIKNLVNASFANVALSSRLTVSPLRFYSSGLESAYNLIQLAREIKQGKHPLFTEDAGVDFFAYSIGALLTQVVMMADVDGYLKESRLFAFCGGSVFERMNGNARDIIDQEAYNRIRSYYLNEFLDRNSGLLLEAAFKTMIPSNDTTGIRRAFFTSAKNRIKMVSLKQDIVIPTIGLQEAVGKELSDHMLEELDFSFPYSHQTPFPENGTVPDHVIRESFRAVFDRAAAFLV